MSPELELASWPNFDQVMARTGISRRTLERQVSQKKWRTQKRTRQGGGVETVFDPDEVAARVPAPHSSVVRAAPVAATAIDTAIPASVAEADEAGVSMELIAQVVGMVCQQFLAVMPQQQAEAARPLFVDLEQASVITGLSVGCLRSMVRDGALPSILDVSKSRHRVPKVRRAELERL